LLTGILNFIPNIGPIVAAIPAILIALLEGPDKALGVAIFYLIYQMIDGYVFEPMVEKRTISLPPALTILVQVVMGIYLGTVGVVLAVPLVAVVLVLVKMLYIQDVLHDRVKLPGQEKEESHAKQA
jgi:predicted PurR-regulated permease PerM